MSKRYVVRVKKFSVEPIVVEANSTEEAKKIAWEMNGEPLNTLPPGTWGCSELKEEG
jgi:hypothetical protein